MQAVLENDRRGIKRRHLIFHLRVFDRETGEKLGHVVDISAEGMMLVSESAIDVDRDYKLQMRLPDEEDRPTTRQLEFALLPGRDAILLEDALIVEHGVRLGDLRQSRRSGIL